MNKAFLTRKTQLSVTCRMPKLAEDASLFRVVFKKIFFYMLDVASNTLNITFTITLISLSLL